MEKRLSAKAYVNQLLWEKVKWFEEPVNSIQRAETATIISLYKRYLKNMYNFTVTDFELLEHFSAIIYQCVRASEQLCDWREINGEHFANSDIADFEKEYMDNDEKGEQI